MKAVILLICLSWVRCQTVDCDALPSWFLRDKCLCDSGQNLLLCDVYCKPPYLDTVKCRNVIESAGNDELLCKYLNHADACTRYCDTSPGGMDMQDCRCQYIGDKENNKSPCRMYCRKGDGDTGDEEVKRACACKYHPTSTDVENSQTKDCYNYCSYFETELKREECMCKYLSNTSSCQFMCMQETDEFKRIECLCKLEKELGDNITKINEVCEPLSMWIENHINLTETTIKNKETEIVTKQSEILTKQSEIGKNEGDITSKNTSIGLKKNEIKALEDDRDRETNETLKDPFQSQIDVLNREIDALNREIDGLEENITKLSGEIPTLEGEITDLGKEIGQLNVNLPPTKDGLILAKCHYLDDKESCILHCNSFSDIESKEYCMCSRAHDLENCIKQCDNKDMDGKTELDRSECKCMLDPSYCRDYCNAVHNGGNNTENHGNRELQECLCTYETAHNPDGSVEYSRSCGDLCGIVYSSGEDTKDYDALCNNYCSAQSTEAEPEGQMKCWCDVMNNHEGCLVYCKNISLINETESKKLTDYKGECRKYCDWLGWAEDSTHCLCSYDVEPQMCRDYCDGPKFVRALCGKFCDLWDDDHDKELCKCNYLDGSKCQDYCNSMPTKSEKMECLCNIGDAWACTERCMALGEEGHVVEKARCVCRDKINMTACSDYCDMSLAGLDNSALLQYKCKCDYEQGDEYCQMYSRKLPDKEHIHYECTVRGDKRACYEYCLNYVSVLKNNTETYKCWCEIYGDLTWCPVYCNSLPETHEDSARCKCLHYSHDASCKQYCAFLPKDSPEQKECQCTIMRDAEGTAKDMSPQGHHEGCVSYCASLPTYGERVQCSCKYGLDAARCKEIGVLISGGKAKKKEVLQSELYKPLCDIWNGKKHEENCRYYCDSLYVEQLKRMARSGYKRPKVRTLAEDPDKYGKLVETDPDFVMLDCYCEVVRGRGACQQLCDTFYPDGNKTQRWEQGMHAKCLCEHGSFRDECDRMCPLLFPVEADFGSAAFYKETLLFDECRCNSTQFYQYNTTAESDYNKALLKCKDVCVSKYGKNGWGDNQPTVGDSTYLPYASCYLEYDKENYNLTFCKQFKDDSMRVFCECFYNPNGTTVRNVCPDYCIKLASDKVEGPAEDQPMVKTCQCLFGNDSSCEIFCDRSEDASVYSSFLCRRYCAIVGAIADVDKTKQNEYMKCLCNAGEASGCKTICDLEFDADSNNLTNYYKCRCFEKLDHKYSCQQYCNSPGLTMTFDACMEEHVKITAGDPVMRGRYADPEYDNDDRYVILDDIPKEEGAVEEAEPEEAKAKEEEEEEEKEEEEEEEEKEPVVEEQPVVEKPKAEGWIENKTNRLIVIIAGSVFVAVLAVAVVVIVVVILRRKRNSVPDEAKDSVMDSLDESGKAGEEIERAEPSYINDYDYEEQKKTGLSVHSSPSDDSNYE